MFYKNKYIMLLFKRNNNLWVFIHIPKNSGMFIRKEIEKDNSNTIIKKFFDISLGYDLAHIPYCLKNNYLSNDKNYQYFTFVRNPYDRIISAYFYKHPKSTIQDLKTFITNTLQYVLFNSYYSDYIHFYPQYKFLINTYNDSTIQKNIKIFKIENYDNSFIKLNGIRVKKYCLNEYLDEETIKIINNIYLQDFLLLDYPMV